MGKKIIILFIVTSLLNGILIPTCQALFNCFNKIHININDNQASEAPESPDEEVPSPTTKLNSKFEDFILPYFLIYVFESTKHKFFSFHTNHHGDHYIEIISPPPKA